MSQPDLSGRESRSQGSIDAIVEQLRLFMIDLNGSVDFRFYDHVMPKVTARAEALLAALPSETARPDALPQWNSKPSADEIEAHYPSSQHQPDECEMCRFIHDAAKAYVSADRHREAGK